MRVTIEATRRELVAQEDVLKAHIDDLVSEAREAQEPESVAKALGPVIKPNPNRSIEEMKRRWLTAYEKQMGLMQEDVGKLLDRVGARTP